MTRYQASRGRGTSIASSAWIGAKLPAAARRDLDAELQKIWSEPEKREAFIQAAEQFLDEYAKLSRPHVDDRGSRRYRFERAAKASRDLARTIAEFGTIEWQLVHQELVLARRQGDELSHCLATASYFAQLFDRMIQKNPHLHPAPRYRGAGEQIGPSEKSLVRSLAWAFANVDGKRPSAADEGLFSKALTAILAAGGLGELKFGQKRLRPLVSMSEFDPPPRGPRPRTK